MIKIYYKNKKKIIITYIYNIYKNKNKKGKLINKIQKIIIIN